MSFQAKIIADSKNEFGNRITTFLVTFPRIILAELNTHRMLSKNSASSRAIPFAKMVKAVEDNPFIPIAWQKDHKGMQGSEYFTDKTDIQWLINNHLAGRDYAIERAKAASDRGLTKQLCNRYLEPFMWHTVLITGTDFENFFALRAHEAAEIHMQKLAYMMLEEYNKSIPKQLKAGEWHKPFIDEDIIDDLAIGRLDKFNESKVYNESYLKNEEINLLKISTARCARTSYTLVGEESKEHDYEADIKLHDRLLESGHLSPFEHCARAMNSTEYYYNYSGELVDCEVENTVIPTVSLFNPNGKYGISGNFTGFIQYRKTIEGENKNDDRVIKK